MHFGFQNGNMLCMSMWVVSVTTWKNALMFLLKVPSRLHRVAGSVRALNSFMAIQVKLLSLNKFS